MKKKSKRFDPMGKDHEKETPAAHGAKTLARTRIEVAAHQLRSARACRGGVRTTCACRECRDAARAAGLACVPSRANSGRGAFAQGRDRGNERIRIWEKYT